MISFADLIGQEEIVNELMHESACGRMNHSYLFEGRSGSGRMTLARAVAGMKLCESPTEKGACGNCRACRMMEAGSHPDYLELPREPRDLRKGRFISDSRGTEKVEHQPVLDFLRLRAQMSAGRVCVIPDAERMNEDAANAFLKTLEEPPAGALLLLTTSARDRLLSTIVSRCRRVRVRPLTDEIIAREVEKRGLASGAQAMDLALMGEGSLGAAVELASGETLDDWHWLQQAFGELTPAGAVRLAGGILQRANSAGADNTAKRNQARRMLDLAALYIRLQLRKGFSPRSAAEILKILWDAGEEITANVRPDLVIHSAALETISQMRRSVSG